MRAAAVSWRASLALAVCLAVAALAAMPVYGATAQAGSNVLLGQWTVHFTPSTFNGRGINIRRPAQLINGLVIRPGTQFNFVKAAGPFTRANGYVTGAAIVNGEVKPDGVLGGGLCSAATTVFNAAVRAGLQIDRRTNHHFYISRYPVGLDATIWTSGGRATANVVFTNDTRNPITIRAITGRRYVTFQVWGVSDGRKVVWADPVITNIKMANTNIVYSNDLLPGRQRLYLAHSDGFDVLVGRRVIDAAGFVIHADVFKSDYARETGIIKRGRYPRDPAAGTVYAVITPKPTGPPSPTPKPTVSPSPKPTASPTAKPTATPSPKPTASPTAAPTAPPTAPPTAAPTDSPAPTDAPTDAPTETPGP